MWHPSLGDRLGGEALSSKAIWHNSWRTYIFLGLDGVPCNPQENTERLIFLGKPA